MKMSLPESDWIKIYDSLHRTANAKLDYSRDSYGPASDHSRNQAADLVSLADKIFMEMKK